MEVYLSSSKISACVIYLIEIHAFIDNVVYFITHCGAQDTNPSLFTGEPTGCRTAKVSPSGDKDEASTRMYTCCDGKGGVFQSVDSLGC